MNKEQRIKNYTTDVPADRTVLEIEKMLIGFGADAIMKSYRPDGRIEALSFKYQGRGYRLPTDIERCLTLLKETPGYSRKDRGWQEAQAERVAWRVIRDWLDSQIALTRIGQAELDQIMLPYMWDGRQSLYESLKQSNFILPAPRDELPELEKL